MVKPACPPTPMHSMWQIQCIASLVCSIHWGHLKFLKSWVLRTVWTLVLSFGFYICMLNAVLQLTRLTFECRIPIWERRKTFESRRRLRTEAPLYIIPWFSGAPLGDLYVISASLCLVQVYLEVLVTVERTGRWGKFPQSIVSATGSTKSIEFGFISVL